MSNKLHIVAGAVLGSIATLGVWAIWSGGHGVGDDAPEPQQVYSTFDFLNDPSEGGRQGSTQDTPHDEPSQAGPFDERLPIDPGPAPNTEPGWVLLVDGSGSPVEADVLLGTAGMWPFETYTSRPDGWVQIAPNEVTTFANQPMTIYEVLARSADRETPVASWGEVVLSDATEPVSIVLAGAEDLTVRVEDPSGAPIPGAFVRLARSSVGLLSLTTTADADGTARFTRLPRGTYTVAVNADGHRRTEVTATHPDSEDVVVALETGSGSRVFEAWRGPPGGTPPSARTTSPPGSPSTEAADSDEIAAASGAELEVYAVDAYGGPIVGAWVEAWSHGRLVATGLTAGNTPATLAVPDSFDGDILAIHGGWGEKSGRMALGQGEAKAELVLTLSDPLLSNLVGPGRLDDLDVIEELLGAELVEDGQRILIDADDAESPAARAGVERGDNLLSIRRVGSRHEIVIERRGRVQKLTVP